MESELKSPLKPPLKSPWTEVLPMLEKVEPGQSVLVGEYGPNARPHPYEIVRDHTEMWYVELHDNDVEPRCLGSFTTASAALQRIVRFIAERDAATLHT